jgi:hypothetical protein
VQVLGQCSLQAFGKEHFFCKCVHRAWNPSQTSPQMSAATAHKTLRKITFFPSSAIFYYKGKQMQRSYILLPLTAPSRVHSFLKQNPQTGVTQFNFDGQ